jgi:hypothetical protein
MRVRVGVELHEWLDSVSYKLAGVIIPTVLGYFSSYIWPVLMGQYPVGGFVITQVFSHWGIMGQAHNWFPVFSWYHYLADQFSFILHTPFSHQYFVFHEIANMNLLCLLYREWLGTRQCLSIGSSIIDLWSWTVSKCDFESSSVSRKDLCSLSIKQRDISPSLFEKRSLTLAQTCGL